MIRLFFLCLYSYATPCGPSRPETREPWTIQLKTAGRHILCNRIASRTAIGSIRIPTSGDLDLVSAS